MKPSTVRLGMGGNKRRGMAIRQGKILQAPLSPPIQRLSAGILGLLLVVSGLATASNAQSGGSITLRADVQEADANTGIITARGHVRIDYPEE